MKFVHLATCLLDSPFEIIGIVADRQCGAVEYGKKNGIPTCVFTPWKEKTEEIIVCIRELQPDIVVTNISKILPKEIFSCCEAVFINLHYSLLPSFGGVIGMKTVELAREKQSKIIGATCHYVTEELDGGPIISQGAMPVDWAKDNNQIEKQIFRIACKSILGALNQLCGITNKKSSSDGFLYSPELNFDDSFFSEDFWDKTR